MTAQLEALLRQEQAIRTQPCWLGGLARHSRLPVEEGDTSANTLTHALTRVLADLSETLSLLPDELPLAVLLEVDSSLPKSDIDTTWQQVWHRSGIRQAATAVEGSGLGVIDHWLDLRSADRSLLLVIACQIAPDPPAGTAEVAVGLLLGNPCGVFPRPAMACVHRPQQACQATGESWGDAVALSLVWANQPREAVEHAWRAGIAAPHETAMTTVLMGLPAGLKRNTHNVDAMLGHAGAAAPWSAMAAAALGITQGAGVHVIFSGERATDSVFWSTVLSPAVPEI
ncbi:hypothetical protein [Pseudomonas sp. NPDC008258]|uniref:hypothetical protein n=1 Tax=Pseudomonas sp. NPDC008258 TaxID=3364418 RepID=UPI0036EED6F4